MVTIEISGTTPELLRLERGMPSTPGADDVAGSGPRKEWGKASRLRSRRRHVVEAELAFSGAEESELGFEQSPVRLISFRQLDPQDERSGARPQLTTASDNLNLNPRAASVMENGAHSQEGQAPQQQQEAGLEFQQISGQAQVGTSQEVPMDVGETPAGDGHSQQGLTQGTMEAGAGFSVSGGITAMEVDPDVKREAHTHTEVKEDEAGRETKVITTSMETRALDSGSERKEEVHTTTTRVLDEPGHQQQQETKELKSVTVAESTTDDGSRVLTTERETRVVTKRTTTSSEMADEIFSEMEKKGGDEPAIQEEMVAPEQASEAEMGVKFGGGGFSMGGFSAGIAPASVEADVSGGGFLGGLFGGKGSTKKPEGQVSGEGDVSGGAGVSGGVSGGDISFGLPSAELSGGVSGDVSGGDTSVQLPSGQISGGGIGGGDFSMGLPSGGVSGGGFSVGHPSADISGGISGDVPQGQISGGLPSGHISGGDISGKLPSGQMSGGISGDVPSGQISGGGVSGGDISLGMPSGGISGGVSGGGISGDLPSGQISGGDISMGLPSGGLSGDVGFSGQVPEGQISGGVPSGDISVRGPGADISHGGDVNLGQMSIGGQLPSVELQGGAAAQGGDAQGTGELNVDASPSKSKFLSFFGGKKDGKDKSLDRKHKKGKGHIGVKGELDPGGVVIVADDLHGSGDLKPGSVDSLKRRGHHTSSPREIVIEDKVVITEKQERGVVEMPEEFTEISEEEYLRNRGSPFRGRSPFRGSPFAGKKLFHHKGEDSDGEGSIGGKGSISLRPASMEVDIKGSPKTKKHHLDVHGDVNIPSEDEKEPPSKKRGFHFELPSLKGKGHKEIDHREIDVDIGVKGDSTIDLETPDIPEMKMKGGAEITKPEVDISGGGSIEGPDMGQRVVIEGPDAPKFKGEFEGPDIGVTGDIKGPEVSVDGDTSIHGPKVPEVDLSGGIAIPQPHISGGGSVDIKGTKPYVTIEQMVKDEDDKSPDAKKSHKMKMPGFNIKGPKFGSLPRDGKYPEVTVEGDVTGPDVDIKRPRIEGGGDVDVDIRGPQIKGGGDIDSDAGSKKGSLGRKFKFGGMFKGGKHDGGKVDVNIPGGSIDVKGPDADIKGPEGEISGPKVEIETDIRAPKGDIDIKGPEGDIDIKGPEGDVDIKGPKVDIDVEGPDVKIPERHIDVTGPDVDIKGKGKKHKFKMPTFGMTAEGKKGFTVEETDELRIGPGDKDSDSGSKKGTLGRKFKFGGMFKGGKDGPDFDGQGGVVVKGPDVDVRGPDVDVSGGGGADINGPSIDIDGGRPGVDLDISGKGKQGEVVVGESVEIREGQDPGKGGFHIKGPKFNFGGFGKGGAKGPDVSVEGGGHIDGDLDVKGPDVDIRGPTIDIQGPDVSGGGDIDIQGGGGIDVQGPDVDIDGKKPEIDIDIKGPKIEGPDVDIGGKGKVDIKGPDVELDVKGKKPKRGISPFRFGHKQDERYVGDSIEVREGQGGNFDVDMDTGGSKKGSLGKKFKFGGMFKGGKGVDIKGPEGEISGPKVEIETDIRAPKGDIDIKGPEGDIDIKGPEGDVDIKGPKVDIDVEGPDVKIPERHIDVTGPDVDIKGKGKKHKFKMPTFGMAAEGKKGFTVEETDELRIGPGDKDSDSGSKKGTLGRKFKFGGMFKGGKDGPDFDGQGGVVVKGPDIDIKGPSIDVRGPEVDMDVDGPDVKTPEADIDIRAKGPDADIDIQGPRVDISGPDADINGKGKGKFGIKLPKFGLKGKGDIDAGGEGGVDIDAGGKSPRVDVELDVNAPKIKGPEGDVHVSGGGDMDSPSFKKKFGFKMPHIGFKGGKGDIDGSGDVDAGGKGHIDVSGPDADIRGPKVDVELDVDTPKIKGPEGDIHVSGGGDMDSPSYKKKFGFKMPQIGFKGSKGDIDAGGDMDVDAGGKGHVDVELDVNAPKVKGPEGDVHVSGGGDMDSPSYKKKFGFKMPQIGFKGSKGDIDAGGDMDVDAGGKGHVDVELDVNAPKVKGPEGDVHVSGGGDMDSPSYKKKFGFKMPQIGFKGSKGDIDAGGGMDVDAGGKGNVDVELDVNAPKVRGPEGDVHVSGGGDMDSPSYKKKFGFKMPQIGFKGSKGDIDAGGDMDMDAGGKGHVDVELDVNAPKVKGPEGDVHVSGGGDMDSPSYKKKFGFKMPQIGFKGSKGDIDAGGDMDMDAGGKGHVDVELDVNAPKVKGPEGDVHVSGGGDMDSPSYKKKFGFKMPQIGFKGSKGDIDAGGDMDVDAGGKGHVDVELDVNAPKVKGPEGDVHVSGGGDMDSPSYKKKFGFKMPQIGFKGSKGDIDAGGDMDVDAGGKGQVDISGPHADVKGPHVDVELDVGTPKVKGPEGDVHIAGDVDTDSPSYKKKFGFKMPHIGFKGGKHGDADIGGSGDIDINAGGKGKVDVSGPDAKGPKVDVELGLRGPDAGTDSPSSKKKFGFKMPHIGFKGGKHGDVDVGGGGDIDAGGRGKIDIDAPDIKGPEGQVDISGPDVDVRGPKVDVDLDVKTPEIKGPKGDIHVTGPDADIDASGKGKGKFKVKMPKFGFKGGRQEEAVVGGDVEVREGYGGDVDVDGGSPKKGGTGKFGFKMPHIGFKGGKGDVDVGGSGDADIDVKGPSGDIDISGPDVDVRGPKVDVDLDVKGPKVKGPKGDIHVSGPDADVNGKGKGKFGFKLPKFGFNKGKGDVDVKGGADVDVKGPEGHIDVSGPDADIKGPHVDVELDVGTPKIKGPEGDVHVSGGGDMDSPSFKKKFGFKMPHIGFKGGKGDVDVKGGADVDVKGPEGHIDVSGPDADIKGPHVDVELDVGTPKIKGPEGDVHVSGGGDMDSPSFKKKFGFKMPHIGFKGGKGDVDVKGGADVDVKGPEGHIDVSGPDADIKGPHVDVELDVGTPKVKGPEGDIHVSGGGDMDSPSFKKKFGFKMPHIGFKGGKGDVDVKGGADVDVKGPEGHIDVSGPDADIKGPQVDVELDVGTPKIKGPEGDVHVSGGGDMDSPSFKKKFGFKMPHIGFKGGKGDVDVKGGADVDVKGPEGQVDITGPDADIGGQHVDVELDVNAPKIKGPEGDIHVSGPDGSPKKGGFGGFGIKMPHIGFKGGKHGDADIGAGGDIDIHGKGPEIDVKGPEGHVDVSGPDADITGPKVDVELSGPGGSPKKGGFGGFGIKMPHIGFKGGKHGDADIGAGGDIDIQGKGPEIDVKGPEGHVDVSGPDADIKGPKVDVELSGPGGSPKKGGFGGFGIKMPHIGFKGGKHGDADIGADANIRGPSGDIDGSAEITGPGGHIKGPHVDAELDVNAPEVRGPEGDIHVSGPDVDIDGKGKKKFGIKMPSFGFKHDHDHDAKADVDVDVDGGSPKKGGFGGKFGFKMPHIGFKGGKGDIDAGGTGDINVDAGGKGHVDLPDVDVKGPEVDVSGGLDVRGPQFEGSGQQTLDIRGPEGGIDIKGPEFNGPEVDLALKTKTSGSDKSDDGKGTFKIKAPKIKMPGFFGGGKGKQVELVTGDHQMVAEDQGKGGIHLHGPEVSLQGDAKGDIDLPGVKVEPGTVQVQGPDPGQVHLEGPDVDLKGKGDISVSGPDVTVKKPEVDIKASGHVSDKDKRNTPGKRLMALFQSPSRHSGADFEVDVKGKGKKHRSRSTSSSSSSSSQSSGKRRSGTYKKKFNLFRGKGDKGDKDKANRHSLNVSLGGGSKGSLSAGTPSPSKSRKKFFTFGGFGKKKSPRGALDISMEGKAEKYPDDKEEFIPMEVDTQDSIKIPGIDLNIGGGLDATQTRDLPGSHGAEARGEAQGKSHTFQLPSFSGGFGFHGSADVQGPEVIVRSTAGEQHAERPTMEGEAPIGFSTPKGHKGPSANTTMYLPSASMAQSPDHSFEIQAGIEGNLSTSLDSGTASDPSRQVSQFVVVAIDFGTTYSGYAFSFTHDPTSIHMMRKWEGGDPGVINQKTPTCLLLTPEGKFHSFGFTARDIFHDLDPEEAKEWLYFDKFKMALHYMADLNEQTALTAINGQQRPALEIFSHALRYFKEHALQQMKDQSSTNILNEDVRWVITVPAIWKAEAKQFMRRAAYDAGIASATYPDQLLIALEPEAASIYCRKLRLYELMHDRPALPEIPLSTEEPEVGEKQNDRVADKIVPGSGDSLDGHDSTVPDIYYQQAEWAGRGPLTTSPLNATIVGTLIDQPGSRYIVVDCGGGTVDITVHEILNRQGNLKELYKATGGPYGAIGVDREFEKLLVEIFGTEFIEAFRYKRPAGYVDLMIAFESRKRAASPFKSNPLNISLPFSFIDFYKKWKGGGSIESAIRKYGNNDVRWSTQGMMRVMPDAMKRLFTPTLADIRQAIRDVISNPNVTDIEYMFLVGGFAESPMLRADMEEAFGVEMRIMSPSDVGLSILKGAVHFGLDPTVVNVRRSRLTYGVGVLNRFREGIHPENKRVSKDGQEWCTDVFDLFVSTDQPIALGDTVLRSYTPAKRGQKSSIINIYCSERNDISFITDPGVRKCGTLYLDLSELVYEDHLPRRREIQTRMIFGDTEIKVSALDVATNTCVKAAIDFLNK